MFRKELSFIAIDTLLMPILFLDKVLKNCIQDTIIMPGVIVDVFYDHFLAKNWLILNENLSVAAFYQSLSTTLHFK
jgi:acyl carrier protein phosphodiesterase